MRFTFAPLLLLVPAVAVAQTAEIDAEVRTKLAAQKFVLGLYDAGGGFKATAADKPGLRATSAAVRSLKYLGGMLPDPEKTAAFVLSCYDPTGGVFFDTPGPRPDGVPPYSLTAVGVMVAVELAIPKEKFARAMDYLKANAKGFEDVRIGAAAVEAWGVKECPFDLTPWLDVANRTAGGAVNPPKDGGARDVASVAAFRLRLGHEPAHRSGVLEVLRAGQRSDGGWGKAGEAASDAETTYRVMRAFMLLKEKPADAAKVRAFLLTCRNPDGGFGAKPGEASSVGGVYYYAIVTKWLDGMAK